MGAAPAEGLRVDAQVLKVGHHGSRSSSSDAFLRAVAPQTAVYMADGGNSYGHPHEETMVSLTDLGADVYGTDTNGSIVFVCDGGAGYSAHPSKRE